MTVNRNGSNQAETSVAAAAALRTIQDELSDFKLNRFHAERLPSFLNDFDTIMDAVRTGHSQLVDTACELEQYGQSSEVIHQETFCFLLAHFSHGRAYYFSDPSA